MEIEDSLTMNASLQIDNKKYGREISIIRTYLKLISRSKRPHNALANLSTHFGSLTTNKGRELAGKIYEMLYNAAQIDGKKYPGLKADNVMGFLNKVTNSDKLNELGKDALKLPIGLYDNNEPKPLRRSYGRRKV